MLVVIYPRMVYAALLSFDYQHIVEPAPIMKEHAPPGALTKDVIAWYESHGAWCRVLPPAYAW